MNINYINNIYCFFFNKLYMYNSHYLNNDEFKNKGIAMQLFFYRTNVFGSK